MLLLVVLILWCICFLIHKVQEYNQRKSSSAASTPFDLRNSLTFQGTYARLLAQGSLPDLWSLNPTDGMQKDSLLLSLCISSLPCPSPIWLHHYGLACCPYFSWQNLVNLTPECSETSGNTLNSGGQGESQSTVFACVFWWHKLFCIRKPLCNIDSLPEKSFHLRGQQNGCCSWPPEYITITTSESVISVPGMKKAAQVPFQGRCYPHGSSSTVWAEGSPQGHCRGSAHEPSADLWGNCIWACP